MFRVIFTFKDISNFLDFLLHIKNFFLMYDNPSYILQCHI